MIYHGGYNEVCLPEIIRGRYAKDFGVGFYCTELQVQAVRWAKRFDTPIVSIYDFKIEATCIFRNVRFLARFCSKFQSRDGT